VTKTIERKQLINPSTGEIYSENIRHISAAFEEDKGYLFWARKDFARSFLDIDFPQQMTFDDRGRMATLAKKMWGKINMLGYRGHGGAKPYNEDKIAAIVGLSPARGKRFINKMVRLGVIARVEVKSENKVDVQYYINPIYFHSGNRISLNLYLIFRKQLDYYLPEWVKQKFNEKKACE
jgi:hypothetical protein